MPPALPLDYRDYAAQVREFFDATMKTARRRKLAGGFDEKPMNKAIKNFADEAEKLEQDRQDCALRTGAHARRSKRSATARRRHGWAHQRRVDGCGAFAD